MMAMATSASRKATLHGRKATSWLRKATLSAQGDKKLSGQCDKCDKPDGVRPYSRRITRFRISLMSSIAKRMPSRPRPESLTPP